MIDVIKEAMNLLLTDNELMNLLNNDNNAICRIRAPSANTKPRVMLSLMNDSDSDYYDGKSIGYEADIYLIIYKADSQIFEISNRINEIFMKHYFNRHKNTDGYDFDCDLYFKEMVYKCKMLKDGSEYIWVRQ